MTADLAPWETGAEPTEDWPGWSPLTPDTLRETTGGMYAALQRSDDRALLPAVLHHLVAEVGKVATDPASTSSGWASDLLRTCAQRAKSGMPPGEPEYDPDDYGPMRRRDITLEDG